MNGSKNEKYQGHQFCATTRHMDVGRKLIKEFKEVFSSSLRVNICDFFPILRWVSYQGLEKNMIRLQRKRDEVLGRLFEEIKLNNVNIIDVEKMWPVIETLFSLRKSEPEFFSDDVIKSLTLVSQFKSLSLLLNGDFDYFFVVTFSWKFCEVTIQHCCSNIRCRVICKININCNELMIYDIPNGL